MQSYYQVNCKASQTEKYTGIKTSQLVQHEPINFELYYKRYNIAVQTRLKILVVDKTMCVYNYLFIYLSKRLFDKVRNSNFKSSAFITRFK